jgi:hypothetical protein
VSAEEVEASAAPFSLAHELAQFIQGVQSPTTGLPASFAGSGEERLRSIAFTYDVAVAALVLTHAGELASARRALQPYMSMPKPELEMFYFNTAYHTGHGRPALEYHVHGGPVFWIAIALMRYGQAIQDEQVIGKGIDLLEWARTGLPHVEGGVAMGHEDIWTDVMSVENNWVYYAALRLAVRLLPPGPRRDALQQEQRGVKAWLYAQGTHRGPYDTTKALDVYTHILLVGPEAHRERFSRPADMAAWAQAHIAELEALFRVPDSGLYDYTDAKEAAAAGRKRAGWLE